MIIVLEATIDIRVEIGEKLVGVFACLLVLSKILGVEFKSEVYKKSNK